MAASRKTAPQLSRAISDCIPIEGEPAVSDHLLLGMSSSTNPVNRAMETPVMRNGTVLLRSVTASLDYILSEIMPGSL